ncbi:MAG: hypothetical protein JWQ04_3355 [Pedosphaera sp.]|nr:hypothetical protein [Pedosphaera sp.]
MRYQHNANPSASFRSLLRRASLALLATALAGISQIAYSQTYTLTPAWTDLAGIGTPTTNLYSTNAAGTGVDGGNRGIAYSAISNLVYVSYRAGGYANVPIMFYDGNTGAIVGTNAGSAGLNMDQIGCADDGVLYGMPLSVSVSTATKIYSWSNSQVGPYTAYQAASGDPVLTDLPGKRVGDSLAVTGSGTNTLIIAGVGGTAAWVLWSTTDGINFTPTVLTNTSSGTFPNVQGISFYTNNTFIVKGGGNLFLIQFPSNFASLPSPVTTTLLGSAALSSTGGSSASTQISFTSAGKFIATATQQQSSTTVVNLFDMSSFPSSATGLTSTNFTTSTTAPFSNGNQTGGAALGGSGKTNMLYVLSTNYRLQAYTIGFTPAPLPPTISTVPVGGTVYVSTNGFSFSVGVGGSQPFAYHWQYNTVSNVATAVNIPNATNATYAITNLTTNATGWYDVQITNPGGVTSSVPVLLTVTAPLTNVSVTQLWSLPADGSQPYLDTGYNTRGLAFDPSTMTVVVAEHATANIYALDALTGSNLYTVTTPQTGLPSGSIFPVGQVGVADDGAMYVCNVSSYQPGQQSGGGVDFSITRFDAVAMPGSTNYNFAAAFSGDPGNAIVGSAGSYSGGDRWGDSFAIRGGGTNTQILLGTYETLSGNGFGTGPGTNVSILTTQDGINFNATTLVITDPTQSSNTPPSGFSYLGVAWGASNTFWTKSPGFNLRQIRYDLASGTGTVIQNFATTASQGSLNNLDGIGLDNSNNILAGVLTSDNPNDLELFQIPSAGFPPQAYYQAFFGAYNPNINGNAATTIKFPYIFSLDANNGIIGLRYSIPLLPVNVVSSYTGNKFVLTWQTVLGRTYQLQSATALGSPASSTAWSNVGSSVTASASASLSYTNSAPGAGALFYRLVAH